MVLFALLVFEVYPALVDVTVAEHSEHVTNLWIELVRTEDQYTLLTSCGGCLLAVDVADWTSAGNPRDRRLREGLAMTIAVAADNAPTDEAVFRLEETCGSVFAFDVVALIEPVAGQIFEKHVTLFGRLDSNGSFSAIDWTTWACESGMVRCEMEEDGSVVVILSEDNHE
jgi:hypothetical protein